MGEMTLFAYDWSLEPELGQISQTMNIHPCRILPKFLVTRKFQTRDLLNEKT